MNTCKVEFKGFNIDSSSLDNYLNQFTIDGKQKIEGAKNTISYLLNNAEDNKLGVLKLALNSNKAYIKDLANMMLNTNRKFYAEVDINNNLQGFSKYNANDNKIYINVDAISQRFSESAEEYLYERIVHDFIQGFANKELKKAYSDANRDSPHMRNIINLFKEYQNITDKKQYDLFKGSIEKEPLLDPRSERSLVREGYAEGIYRAVTNPAEFLSYGLSSTQFRNTLRKRNLWQKFVSWLKDLLGISQDNNDLEYLYKNLDAYLKNEEEKGSIKVEQQNRYSVQDVRANPDKIFVFGDNSIRQGTGGQAQIRHEPNAVGIMTKKFPRNTPDAFLYDSEYAENIKRINEDIKNLKQKADDKTIVFPTDGIGTNLADIAHTAPKTMEYLINRLKSEFGLKDSDPFIKSMLNKLNEAKSFFGQKFLIDGKIYSYNENTGDYFEHNFSGSGIGAKSLGTKINEQSLKDKILNEYNRVNKVHESQTSSQEETNKIQENYGEEFQVDQFIFSYNPETGKYYQYLKSKKGEVKELTNEKQQNKTFLKYIEKHLEHAEIVTYDNTGNKYVYDKQRDKVISLSTGDTIVQSDIVDKVKNHEEYEHKKEVERVKKIVKSNISSLNDIDMLELFHELINKGYDIKDEVIYFEALLEIREDEKKEIHKKEEPIKKEEIAKEEKPKKEEEPEDFFSYKGITIPTKFKLSEEQEQALITLIENITSGDTEPITLSGFAGCLAYGTKILMFDGSYKEVQDIVVGDKLMGIDSTPRTVLELKRGREQMYWIHQNKGMSYRVNESHILSTKHHKKGLVNQTVLEYLSHKTSAKDYKGYKANLIEFPEKELKIDPYFLGLWLGDGTTGSFPNITNNDIEVEHYLKENFTIKGIWKKENSKNCKTYNLYKEGISEEFKKYFGLTNKSNLESKFIPKNFLINSSENRKKLLAGLIDTDGYLDIKRKEYEIVTKHEQLAKDITFLIRSLGFYVNCRVKYATCTNCKEKYYKVWRITFSVDKELPILIERRKVQELSNFKNRLHTGLRIEKDIVDDYYGFTLDGDNLFILEDFTVTHNTGKTSVIGYLEDYLKKKRGYKFLYGAPTHAATLYLGYNTKKMPFTIASSVVKRIGENGSVTYTTSSKVDQALSDYDQNIFVVDEVSLMDSTTMDNFLSVMNKKGIKVIFMGDKMQLPEVASKGKINPETKNPIKDVSKAFTDFKLIQLSKVQRTKDNAILRVLTEIRNNPDGVLPVVDNTETLQFFNKDDNTKGFYKGFRIAYEADPEEAIYITYTNEDVKNFNKSFRKAFYGEDVDGLVEGESVIGYSGYNNKKIKSNDLANSIKYTVENVSYDGSEVKITLKSNAVQKLADLHTPNKENDKTVQTTYLQMSRTDSLDMKNLTEEDFLKNNIRLSETFRDVYDLKKRALETNKWRDFSETLAKMTGGLAKLEIGDDYFYNPYTNMMEKESSVDWSKPEMANLKRNYKELFMSKSIDYGYGITIHKAQGATYKNVFFNATSTEFAKTEIHENGMQISTEGNSLNYVAMSRASEKLFVLHSNNIKRLNNDNSIELSKNCSIF
jgi:replicative DNA helicase dnaB, intein-containing|nr:MAG TPA: ATP dependent DNA helicase [Caudoviricetes sp.]